MASWGKLRKYVSNVRGRMPKKIYIPLPDGPARRGLIAHVLSSQKHVLKVREHLLPFLHLFLLPLVK